MTSEQRTSIISRVVAEIDNSDLYVSQVVSEISGDTEIDWTARFFEAPNSWMDLTLDTPPTHDEILDAVCANRHLIG